MSHPKGNQFTCFKTTLWYVPKHAKVIISLLIQTKALEERLLSCSLSEAQEQTRKHFDNADTLAGFQPYVLRIVRK